MMRRLLCLTGAILICLSLACPAFAATGTFTPSVTYKDTPDIVGADLNGEDVGGCLEVSSVTDAKEKTTDISQDARDTLIDVYEKLANGSMKLPYDGNADDYVIRELVDVSFKETTCVPEHTHEEDLPEDGTTITIDFDLGIGKNTEVIVMTYVDGKWAPIKSVKNLGNGVVSCVFEDICPVAFAVKQSYYQASPKTGDQFGQNLGVWIGVMAVSVVALVAIVVIYIKKKKK